MNGFLLALVAVIYLWVAINYTISGNTGMGLAFAAYSVANIGLYLAGLR